MPTPPARPKSKTPTWVWLLVGVIGVCCVIPMIVGMIKAIADPASLSSPRSQATDQPAAVVETTAAPAPVVTTEAAPPPPLPPTTPAGPATSFGSGTYEVGVDIKAGTYTCTAGSRGAYWERARNASGEFSAIITNDNIPAGAQGIVTVKAKEYFKIEYGSCTIR